MPGSSLWCDTPYLELGKGPKTMEFWIYFLSDPHNYNNSDLNLIASCGSSVKRYDNLIFETISSGINLDYCCAIEGSSTKITAFKWHHIAITYDGIYGRLFIDGQMAISYNGRMDGLVTKAFCIGTHVKKSTSRLYTDQYIANMAVYNRCKYTANFSIQA